MLELNVGGVFLPSMLVWAAVAFVLTASLGHLLNRVGFYRLVWHRALFDVSLFVILWAAVAAIPYHLAFSRVWPG